MKGDKNATLHFLKALDEKFPLNKMKAKNDEEVMEPSSLQEINKEQMIADSHKTGIPVCAIIKD